jgi:hypothetical protein
LKSPRRGDRVVVAVNLVGFEQFAFAITAAKHQADREERARVVDVVI